MTAVSANQPVRVMFNCPVAGQYRMVELIGTPGSAGSRRWRRRAMLARRRTRFPRRTTTRLRRPNNDGPLRYLPPHGDVYDVDDDRVLARRNGAHEHRRHQPVAADCVARHEHHPDAQRQNTINFGEWHWQNPTSPVNRTSGGGLLDRRGDGGDGSARVGARRARAALRHRDDDECGGTKLDDDDDAGRAEDRAAPGAAVHVRPRGAACAGHADRPCGLSAGWRREARGCRRTRRTRCRRTPTATSTISITRAGRSAAERSFPTTRRSSGGGRSSRCRPIRTTSIILQVLVTRQRDRGTGDAGSVSRGSEEARLMTIKSRKVQ